MGAGPYTFKEWKKGQSLTLEAFKDFYKPGLPRLKKLRFVARRVDVDRGNLPYAIRPGPVRQDVRHWKVGPPPGLIPARA